jgi:hypothetical protein
MKEELRDKIDNFIPFVLTTVDGFSISIADAHHFLIGTRCIAVTDAQDRLYTIPYDKISHLSESPIA